MKTIEEINKIAPYHPCEWQEGYGIWQDGFMEGQKSGYKEAIKMAKEWFNAKTYCLIIDAVKGVTLGEQFEKYINKLLEE